MGVGTRRCVWTSWVHMCYLHTGKSTPCILLLIKMLESSSLFSNFEEYCFAIGCQPWCVILGTSVALRCRVSIMLGKVGEECRLLTLQMGVPAVVFDCRPRWYVCGLQTIADVQICCKLFPGPRELCPAWSMMKKIWLVGLEFGNIQVYKCKQSAKCGYQTAVTLALLARWLW